MLRSRRGLRRLGADDLHHLYRGLAAACPPQSAARLFRLCRRAAPMRKKRCAPTATICCASSCASACWSMSSTRDLGTTIIGEPVPAAVRACADRPDRPAARQWRNPRRPRRAGGGHSLHAQHHVDLLDRRRGGSGRQAVLVPALRDARPRLRARADRARHRGEMQRAGAHRRSASARPAPSRRQERPERCRRKSSVRNVSTS